MESNDKKSPSIMSHEQRLTAAHSRYASSTCLGTRNNKQIFNSASLAHVEGSFLFIEENFKRLSIVEDRVKPKKSLQAPKIVPYHIFVKGGRRK
jgi:hypothetical protein